MSFVTQEVLMDGVSEGTGDNNNVPNSNKRPAPLTHDVSLVGEHAPDIKSVARRLQAAVDDAWPTRGQSQYTQVHVLMLSWADDDLNVLRELRQLETIFQASYHYAVKSWRIPTEKPTRRLQLRLADFLSHDGPETLLIICYAGHAVQDEQRNEPPVWVSRENSARLPSVSVQSIISECDSDVLLLYDCCHAIPTTTGITGRGVKEFLAACGFESIAPEVGRDSFTHALIQELGKASYGSISVGELYGRLIDRLRTWKPCISKNELGQMKFNSRGKPLYERSKRKTPIHCALTNEPRRRSIVLSPLLVPNEPHRLRVSSESPPANKVRKKARYEYLTDDADTSSNATDDTECAQVIISIRVDTENFDLNTWSEWIKDVPPEATKVKIEGVYGSLSTLVLLRMPITTWVLLPDDEAYSFIGFVTTENLAPTFKKPAVKDVKKREIRWPGEPKITNRAVIGGLAKNFAPPSLDSIVQRFMPEREKIHIAKTGPTNKGSTNTKMETLTDGRASQVSQVSQGNQESIDAAPKEERRLSLISPHDRLLASSPFRACCECGEQWHTRWSTSCVGCGHFFCDNCDEYTPKR